MFWRGAWDGRPLRFIITAGQAGDITAAPALLDAMPAEAVHADKAYGSNALRALIASMGAEAVIPSNRCRKIAIPHDIAS
ncbi:transposase [Aquabacter cavernae]|uniref:transposase n=1 Tax=Aquabacter cavernae TaxID=2496029 RepID=UPI000F8CED32